MAGNDNSTTSRASNTSATKAQTKSSTSASSTASNANRDDLGKIINALSTVESAKIYLIEKGYATTGQEYTPASLSTTLTQIAQAPSATLKTLKESIRVVAVLLQDLSDRKTADSILTYITIGLSSQLDKLQTTSEKISESSESLKSVSSDIHSATSNLEYEAERITKFVDELHVDTRKLILNIEAATSDLSTTATAHPITSTETNIPAPPTATYASILQSQLPPDHLTTIARSQSQTHQVLVDVAPGIATNGLQALDEATLVSKANTALDLMGIQAEDKPSNTSFLAARRLKNGGVVYNMSSPTAAAWLKTKDVMKAFLESFGGTSIIKDRAYTIIAEFVPVTLDLDDVNACAEIEKDNNLPPLAILSTKWIKPVHKRSQTQTTAHLIIALNTPESANHFLRHGAYIKGKKVWARKLLQEPKRCLKCQRAGSDHLANECKLEHDICGNCGEKHRTNTCQINDPDHYFCVNCKRHGHAAWDRLCPKFMEISHRFLARNPTNKYRFFPTNSPDTWEQILPPNHPDSGIRPNSVHRNPFTLTDATDGSRQWFPGQGWYAGGERGQGGGKAKEHRTAIDHDQNPITNNQKNRLSQAKLSKYLPDRRQSPPPPTSPDATSDIEEQLDPRTLNHD